MTCWTVDKLNYCKGALREFVARHTTGIAGIITGLYEGIYQIGSNLLLIKPTGLGFFKTNPGFCQPCCVNILMIKDFPTFKLYLFDCTVKKFFCTLWCALLWLVVVVKLLWHFWICSIFS